MSKERAAQLIDAGVWLRLSGDLDGARKLFERALKLDPANERAQQLLQEGAVPVAAPAASETSPEPSPFDPPQVAPVTPTPTRAPDSSSAPTVLEMPAIVPPASDLDWGSATGYESPTPFKSPSPKPEALEAPTETMAVPSSTVSLGAEVVPPVRSTPPIFGKTEQGPALTITLDGEAPPPSPIRATPPQFVDAPPSLRPAPPQAAPDPLSWRPPSVSPTGPGPGVTITITEANAPTPTPPRSTPPLFDSASEPTVPRAVPASTVSPVPVNLDVPLNAAPDPVGVAWAWSTNSPAPLPVTQQPVVPAETRVMPTPQPSPLTPNATSAWDVRSNPGIKLSAIVGEAKALDMISSDSAARKSSGGAGGKDEVKTLLRGARDLLDLDDHTGAMELILKAQGIAPDDPDVRALRERSEKTLLTMFESKLGKLETVPRVLLKEDEIIWLNLDHRAGFVLAQIDGTVCFDDLFAVSGMSRLDTARILAQLVDEGVISKG